MSVGPSDLFMTVYANVAGLAALVELRMRLLGDLIPELAKAAHGKDMSELEEGLLNHYAARLSEDEKELLKKARQLRNKVLHSDFKAAASKVEEIRPGGLSRDQVTKIDLRTGAATPVGETTKREGGVFGWLLECGANGTFDHCDSIFSGALALLDQLTFEKSTEGMSREEAARFRRDPLKRGS